ncbi:hypothetical protein MMC22_009397 [Lobaria immixta]|nr:hypothetical protein [Lobaria immixta]
MQVTVFASLTALMLSLPIYGLPYWTATAILKRSPTIASSSLVPNTQAIKAVNTRTVTATVVDNANIPQRRHAAPLGSICREHADEYPEYCDWVDPVEEAEEDDAITDDQLTNDQTGVNGR